MWVEHGYLEEKVGPDFSSPSSISTLFLPQLPMHLKKQLMLEVREGFLTHRIFLTSFP